MVRAADAVIADVTNASLGVGYELGKAEEWNKPILALYHPQPEKKLSAMVAGNPHITNVAYASVEEASQAIKQFLAELH